MTKWIDCDRTEAESELRAGRKVRVKMITHAFSHTPVWVTVEGAGLPVPPRSCYGLQREDCAVEPRQTYSTSDDPGWVECANTSSARNAHDQGLRLQMWDACRALWVEVLRGERVQLFCRYRVRAEDVRPDLEWNAAPARKAHEMWNTGLRAQYRPRNGSPAWYEVVDAGTFRRNFEFRFARV